MGSEFMEYLWGWQVTNPNVIRSWAWDEVKAVYLDDRYRIGLDEFLEQDANVHVKTNMMAILLVAAQKQFWQADAPTLQQLGQAWVDLLLEHGLPGSGHTQPDHPVFEWIQPHLRPDQVEPLERLLDRARVEAKTTASPSTLTELRPADQDTRSNDERGAEAAPGGGSRTGLVIIVAFFTVLLTAGYLRGRSVSPSGRAV